MMPYLSMQRRRKSIGRSGQQLRREVHNSVVLDGIHKIAQLCGQQVAQFFWYPLREKVARLSQTPILVQEYVGNVRLTYFATQN